MRKSEMPPSNLRSVAGLGEIGAALVVNGVIDQSVNEVHLVNVFLEHLW